MPHKPINDTNPSTSERRIRLVYFGSGEFGLPTLERLAQAHDVALVVTQPDRPAGRRRLLSPTPIAAFAASCNLPTMKPGNVNDGPCVDEIRSVNADAFVVIAFGQKLGETLLQDTFAINLHASLLPRYRGAAPINWAIINGERETGVSVIGLAQRMDAGPIYGQAATTIDPLETAGELHDRLAALGPDIVMDVLRRHGASALIPQYQDDRLATRAPKLSKSDGFIDFNQAAEHVRNRVHGLTPWPGCTVRLNGHALKLLRVEVASTDSQQHEPGTVLDDLTLACTPGSIRLLEVQPANGKMMSFEAYRNGQPVRSGMKIDSHSM